MHTLLCSVPTLALSLIFCLYQTYREELQRRHRRLRERVTYMLWVMARDAIAEGPPTPGPTRSLKGSGTSG